MQTMPYFRSRLGRVVALLLSMSLICRADEPDLAAQTDQAIASGVRALLAAQRADGSWPRDLDGDAMVVPGPRPRSEEDAVTALVTLALLHAGQSPQSPALRRAIDYLAKAPTDRTYTVALRAAVLSMLGGERRRAQLEADVAWLRDAMIARGPWAGQFGAVSATNNRSIELGASGDLSNTQYGVLGLWYAAEAGGHVPLEHWAKMEQAWLRLQEPDGGWPIRPLDGGGARASMTTGGIASLFITDAFLRAVQPLDGADPHPSMLAQQRALAWIDQAFQQSASADPRPHPSAWNLDEPHVLYTMFGIERVAEATGRTRFGGIDWFESGARWLVRAQRPDGAWDAGPGGNVCADTAYALLFLSRGRAPVAIQKLQFAPQWNARPRDVANVVRWLRRQTERHLNWQVVSASEGPARLGESGILYAASDRAIDLSANEKQALRRYLDEGGLLLAVNEGVEHEFARSVVRLGRELYPQHQFRVLPPDHPLLTANHRIRNELQPIVGMSNGVRELILLQIDGDLSWYWQGYAASDDTVTQAFPIMGNLLLYAHGGEAPGAKGTRAAPGDAPPADVRLPLARLRYDGNWNPEPLAWERVDLAMRRADQVGLRVGVVPIAGGINPRLPLAHLTGAGALALSDQEWHELSKYLKNGGTLFFDAAGGDRPLAQHVMKRLTDELGGGAFEPLPRDHPIYTGAGTGGATIYAVDYRRFRGGWHRGGDRPGLLGLWMGGRLLAIVSEEDVTAGLAGAQTLGIVGYAPDSAVRLARNIVLWAHARAAGALGEGVAAAR